MSHILKIGLAVVKDGRLLVLRKRGGRTFILPGGKPEPGEDAETALIREIDEELCCGVTDLVPEGDFNAAAADLPDTSVTVRLYTGRLAGIPATANEIEEMAWIPLDGPSHVPIADSISDHILPHLTRNMR